MRRQEDNIRMDIKEIVINTRNQIDSAQDRDYQRALVNVALKLQFPKVMELDMRPIETSFTKWY